jgi:hypothetical protein
MTTHYKNRVTFACPEILMTAANQLMLIGGESPDDDKTFKVANYEDVDGNKFAICSTLTKGNFLAMQFEGLPSVLPEHAELADTELATEALNSISIWRDTSKVFDVNALTMAVDIEPQAAIAMWGITLITEEAPVDVEEEATPDL